MWPVASLQFYTPLRQWATAREASFTGVGLSWKFLVEGSCLKSGDLALQKFLTEPLCVICMDINHFPLWLLGFFFSTAAMSEIRKSAWWDLYLLHAFF